MDYTQFIKSKQRVTRPMGFDLYEGINDVPALTHGWQRKSDEWLCRRGRAALFAGCGLGKTLMQLVWAAAVHGYTGGSVALLCPVGVRRQTEAEAAKFGIDCPVQVVNHGSEVRPGINIFNYDRLHLFADVDFDGVVLDESSILKNFTGQTKRMLIERFSETPYRLACTATPAPNDHMELGNHAEFLGIMPSNEMLSRWFINDTMRAGGYRLKKHAAKDFWKWVASWAICISKPSDIGGSDVGYDLPELTVNRHLVEVDLGDAPEGMLFNTAGISATTIHEEKRLTLGPRVDCTVEIEAEIDDYCLIWCDTNYEAEALVKRLPHAVEVRGSELAEQKERKLSGFSAGEFKTLITKPSIAGFGMNWQHCNRMIFAGLGFSFEAYYQAVRRCWRFGQVRPVTADVVLADSESAISAAVARKESDHKLMQAGMAEAMREATLAELGIEIVRSEYRPTVAMELPHFLQSRTMANA